MSEQTPRNGDTVRVVLEGRVNNVTDKTIVVETDRNYMPLPLVDISVEVLERADDPAKDPVSTVRQDAGGAMAVKVFQAVDWPDAKPWVVLEDTDSRLRDEEVVGWRRLVMAAVPADWRDQLDGADPVRCFEGWLVSGPAGAEDETIAASSLFPPPVGTAMPMDVRQRVAELLVNGNELAAVNVVANALGCSLKEAGQVVEAMPEWQTGRNHRPVEDVPLPNLGARVFRADGPEPPRDVPVLEDIGPSWGDMKYLLRTGDLWCWSPSRELSYPHHSDPVLWERAARQADGPLREVV